MDTAIAVNGVTKRYGQVTAVRELTLEIPAGRTVALLGPNGAGKTTTVALLTGLVRPDAGRVSVCGLDPRVAVVRGLIAAMLQDAGLMPGVTVGELVGFARECYPDPMSVGEALELAGLAEVARRRVDRLSGGQAQRVKFALVAVAGPRVMLLDEPTRAMDVQARRQFWTSMRAYAASGRTILFATHYLDEVEGTADRVVVMARGAVVADASPERIRGLAGACRVRFKVGVGEREREWEGEGAKAGERVDDVMRGAEVGADGWVTVRAADPDAVVRALVASRLSWSGLTVTPPSLDESFLELVEGGGGGGGAGGGGLEVPLVSGAGVARGGQF